MDENNFQVFKGKVKGTRGCADGTYRVIVVVDGYGPVKFEEGEVIEIRKVEG